MGRIESFRQYATDCMRRAEGEERPEDRDILLNMALAWVRLAKQSADTAGDTAADTAADTADLAAPMDASVAAPPASPAA